MPDWNLVHVKQPGALAQLPKRPNGKVDWGSVKVAHLDTGYTENAAFGPWRNGRNAIVLAQRGRDFLQPRRRSALDPLIDVGFMPPGHGTRSGSALSADGNGFSGVAPGLPLVPFRVTNSSLVTKAVNRAIGRAIDHVVDNRVAPVVSISLGFPFLDVDDMGAAVDRAYEDGIIVVAAAGQEIDRVSYPGKHRRTIGVAGIERYGRRPPKYRPYYEYNRYGRVGVWAPAAPIRRANVDPEPPGEQFGDGTTYSTVHVTAAACMWLRKHGRRINRLYMRRRDERWKRVEAFRRLLATAGRPLPFRKPGDNVAIGLDINRLLRAALPDPASLTVEPDLAIDDRF